MIGKFLSRHLHFLTRFPIFPIPQWRPWITLWITRWTTPMARTTTDAARRRLVALVEANPGHTLQSLSLALGRNHAYLHQYVMTGSPRELRESDRRTLAVLLHCDESELRDGEALPTPVTAGA